MAKAVTAVAVAMTAAAAKKAALPKKAAAKKAAPAKAKKAVSVSKTVKITAPAISTAWAALCSASGKADAVNLKNVEALAKAVKESQLSTRDVIAVIQASKKESSVMSASHVEGLGVWLEMRVTKEFRALPLSKQLSTATAAFKLLGVNTAKALAPKLDVALNEIKAARKAKALKAKGVAPVAKAGKVSLDDSLAAVLALMTSLDFSALSDKQYDLVAEIQVTIESKVMATA